CCVPSDNAFLACLSFVYSIFFSSRRRHTRFSRDWSSDVCSSDLERIFTTSRLSSFRSSDSVLRSRKSRPSISAPLRKPWWLSTRSEERRVGKESSAQTPPLD